MADSVRLSAAAGVRAVRIDAGDHRGGGAVPEEEPARL